VVIALTANEVPSVRPQQIMRKEVHIADPNVTIRDLARQMRADNIGSLRVGENDRLNGMVTCPLPDSHRNK
jgi:predicted transcriptional regulator